MEKTITTDGCAKMVEAATRSCHPVVSIPSEPADKTADSLAALSTAFTYGSMLLAIIALFGAVAWGLLVKLWAEREARDEAKKVAKACADEYIREWLAKEAPGIIRERVDFITNATLGAGDDAQAADDIGKEA